MLLLQIDALQHTLTAQQPGWLGFCHNDLQYGNMLLAAHTTDAKPHSLLPADDNVTQGLGREDALSGLGDRLLGSSADLNPMLANLLSENLEGMSPRAAGHPQGAFWAGHPSFSRASSRKRSNSSSSATDRSYSQKDSKSSQAEFTSPSHPAAPAVLQNQGPGVDQMEDMDPAEMLTHGSQGIEETDKSCRAEPDALPSHPHTTTLTAHPPADAHIRLIDYEYAGVNPVALDLANHWCEYAADYHTDTPHVLDYSRFPDHEHRVGFIHAYIQTVVSMARRQGDKLSWDGEEISYSAPAPGAMQIHTDTDCNQSLDRRRGSSTVPQDRLASSEGAADNTAACAPAKREGSLQVRIPVKQLLVFPAHQQVVCGCFEPVKSC